jgi:hypothetical protein
MKLRSIELALPHAGEAAAFLTDIWGMAPAAIEGETHYLRTPMCARRPSSAPPTGWNS